MFTKIHNFLDYCSPLIFCLIFLFITIAGILWFGSWIDKVNDRELDIITKTKDYTIFNSCREINNKYYCWED